MDKRVLAFAYVSFVIAFVGVVMIGGIAAGETGSEEDEGGYIVVEWTDGTLADDHRVSEIAIDGDEIVCEEENPCKIEDEEIVQLDYIEIVYSSDISRTYYYNEEVDFGEGDYLVTVTESYPTELWQSVTYFERGEFFGDTDTVTSIFGDYNTEYNSSTLRFESDGDAWVSDDIEVDTEGDYIATSYFSFGLDDNTTFVLSLVDEEGETVSESSVSGNDLEEDVIRLPSEFEELESGTYNLELEAEEVGDDVEYVTAVTWGDNTQSWGYGEYDPDAGGDDDGMFGGGSGGSNGSSNGLIWMLLSGAAFYIAYRSWVNED